jgi:hypothetical protein
MVVDFVKKRCDIREIYRFIKILTGQEAIGKSEWVEALLPGQRTVEA